MVAHAGIPMEDLLPKIVSRASLSAPEMLADFIWNNLEPDQERKKVSRGGSRRISYGRVNIEEFFTKCNAIGIPAKRLLVGHIHPSGGGVTAFEQYTKIDGPRYPRSRFLQEATVLHSSVFTGMANDGLQPLGVARYRPGEKPELFHLHFSDEVTQRFYVQETVP